MHAYAIYELKAHSDCTDSLTVFFLDSVNDLTPTNHHCYQDQNNVQDSYWQKCSFTPLRKSLQDGR